MAHRKRRKKLASCLGGSPSFARRSSEGAKEREKCGRSHSHILLPHYAKATWGTLRTTFVPPRPAQSPPVGGLPPEAPKERRVAVRVGFEPTVRFPVHTLSKRAP